MKRLILHIGMPKTGTTAIQHFFYKNRERLKAGGYGIPIQTGVYFRKNGGRIGFARNGYFLIPLARVSPSILDSQGSFETAKRDAEAFRNIAAQYDTVLLSDEAFPRMISLGDCFCVSLKELLTGLGVKHTEIIVYLRRQDQYIFSNFRQAVKGKGYFLPFEEFVNSPLSSAVSNYNAWLSELENTFGFENVTVRRYDRSFFPEGDVCRDFCATVGIPWNDDFELPKAAKLSLSLDVTEVKRLVNAVPTYQNSGNFLKASALRVSKIVPDPPGSSLFSPEEATELLARYAEGNRAIAERHFNGEPLFNEDVSGLVKWRRDEGRLLNAAILLFADALAEQRAARKNILSLQRCVTWFAGKLPDLLQLKLKRAVAWWMREK